MGNSCTQETKEDYEKEITNYRPDSIKDKNGNIWMKYNRGWIRMLDNNFSYTKPI